MARGDGVDECDYRFVRCPGVKDGRWKIHGEWQSIYVRADLSKREGMLAAERLLEEGEKGAYVSLRPGRPRRPRSILLFLFIFSTRIIWG